MSVKVDNTSTISAVTGAVSVSATGAGLAASIGVSIANNTFGTYAGDGISRTNRALASIENSTINVAKGNVDVLATSAETLTSVNFAGSVAVAGAGGSAAGSGVQVTNRFGTTTSATLQGSDVTAGITGGAGSVTVRAQDTSTILKSGAYGVAVAASLPVPGNFGLNLALAVTLVDSVAENQVSATINTASGKNVGAYDAVSVLALETTNFKGLDAVTASVAVGGGIAASGAGVRVTNNTRNNVSARVTGGGQVGAFGKVDIKADTKITAEIDLTQVSVAVGMVGAAIGVGIAENISRDTTTASVDGATVSAPVVDLSALVAVDFSQTQTAGVAASTGLAVNVNRALVDIGATTLAEARNGAVLTGVSVTTPGLGVTPGMVNINAQGTYYGRAYSKAITGGIVGVGVMSAETRLGGSLKASVDNATVQGAIVGITVGATTERNGEAGLLAEARSLEVGGVTVSIDTASLTTNLDARVQIGNNARVDLSLIHI